MIGRSFTTEAIVVHLQNRGEKDILLTLLTPNHGRLIAKAPGAKSIKSSRSGALQLGNIVKAHLYHHESFFQLTECQSISPFLLAPKKLIQLNLLFYFLEVIKYFTPENEASPRIFSLAKDIITDLSADHLSSFISHQIDFLETLGFGIPDQIRQNHLAKKYHLVQLQLISYFESVLEKPLHSKKLLTGKL